MYTDGTYLEKNPTWHEEHSPWKASLISKILQRNQIIPSSICEIGCGAGEILNSLTKVSSPETVFCGYEISPQAFEICRHKAKTNLQYFLKDLCNEPDSYFDVVLAIDVFEHIDDYLGFLRQLRHKGKYKIFHIPLDLSIYTVLKSSPILRLRTSVGHLHYFTKETALATLEDTGYEILDYFYTNCYLELPTQGWQTLVRRLPQPLLNCIYHDLTVRLLGGFSLIVLAK
ncbi:MAG: class I SAM-dependent methyltransferase [Pseudanabaena sp. ELA607]|jgi:hypothetical protein